VSAELEQRFADCVEQLLKTGPFCGQRAIELFAYLSGTGVRIEAAIANGAKIPCHELDGRVAPALDLIRRRIKQVTRRWQFGLLAHDAA
jgi:hypothetical protein